MADSAEHGILGQVGPDHRLDFLLCLPAVQCPEDMRGLDALDQRRKHVLFEDSRVDLHRNSPGSSRDFSGYRGTNFLPALPDTLTANRNSDERELVVVGGPMHSTIPRTERRLAVGLSTPGPS